MTSTARCTNHETRLAAARCLECGRSFCRECVTEHQGRLTCAACVRKTQKARPAGKSWRGWIAVPAMALIALLGTWLLFYAAGWWMESVTAPQIEKTGNL